MAYRAIIALIAAFSMVGCTSMRPVETHEPDLADLLRPGDHVIVYEKSGRIADMTVVSFDGTAIRGELVSGAGPVGVGVDEIERLEVEQVDEVKTVLAVVGGTVVLVPLAFVALLLGAGAQGYSP